MWLIKVYKVVSNKGLYQDLLGITIVCTMLVRFHQETLYDFKNETKATMDTRGQLFRLSRLVSISIVELKAKFAFQNIRQSWILKDSLWILMQLPLLHPKVDCFRLKSRDYPIKLQFWRFHHKWLFQNPQIRFYSLCSWNILS